MKIPFQLPVRIESKKFLVAADSELISHLPDATCEEAQVLPRLINAAEEFAGLLRELQAYGIASDDLNGRVYSALKRYEA